MLLLKNLDSSNQLVNGATGVVTEFVDASGRRLPKVEFDTMEGSGKVVTIIREEEWTVSLGNRQASKQHVNKKKQGAQSFRRGKRGDHAVRKVCTACRYRISRRWPIGRGVEIKALRPVGQAVGQSSREHTH